MSWFSILPAHLTIIETWIIRFFVGPKCSSSTDQMLTSRKLLLGICTIGPWALMLVYDLILYISRSIAYEIPYFGGRARGRRRPRAPSLAERPNGRPRSFSISMNASTGLDTDDKAGMRERVRYESPETDDEAFEQND